MSWLSRGIEKIRKGKVGRFFDRHLDEIGTVAGFALGGPLGAGIGRMAGSSVGAEREKTLGGFLKKGVQGYGAGSLAGMIPGVQGLASGGAQKLGLGRFISEGARRSIAPALAAGPTAGVPGTPLAASMNTTPAMIRTPVAAAAAGGGGGTVGALPGASSSLMAGGASTANASPSVGNFIRRARGYFGDPARGLDRSLTALQGAGTLLQGYGAYQQGQAEEELLEEERRRRAAQAEIMAPFIGGMGRMLTDRLQQRM